MYREYFKISASLFFILMIIRDDISALHFENMLLFLLNFKKYYKMFLVMHTVVVPVRY